jgi:hypothetical protein
MRRTVRAGRVIQDSATEEIVVNDSIKLSTQQNQSPKTIHRRIARCAGEVLISALMTSGGASAGAPMFGYSPQQPASKNQSATDVKDDLRPAAALRAAKVEMWKQKRWRAPFYWAAFELQGEWR